MESPAQLDEVVHTKDEPKEEVLLKAEEVSLS